MREAITRENSILVEDLSIAHEYPMRRRRI
jgi:hypothetical protein